MPLTKVHKKKKQGDGGGKELKLNHYLCIFIQIIKWLQILTKQQTNMLTADLLCLVPSPTVSHSFECNDLFIPLNQKNKTQKTFRYK